MSIIGIRPKEDRKTQGNTFCPIDTLQSGIPLVTSKRGEAGTVVKITGKEEVRQHLAHLGLMIGTKVKTINVTEGGMIIEFLNSKLAIDRGLASKIYYSPEA